MAKWRKGEKTGRRRRGVQGREVEKVEKKEGKSKTLYFESNRR